MENILKKSAQAGAKALMSRFKQKLTRFDKTSFQDYYTEADTESQQAIIDVLTTEMRKIGIASSEIGFIGEEGLNIPDKKHMFVVDPLDGTLNYGSGYAHFGISIAYFLDSELHLGLVYDPTTKDVYTAIKGHGAFKNSQRLSVFFRPLKECLVDGFISSRKNLSNMLFEKYKEIFPHVTGYRNLNSMVIDHGLFCENAFNVVINGHTFIWDIAAVKLLTEESGGIMMDFSGQQIKIDLKNPKKEYQVITCHPKLKSDILRFFI